MKQKMTWQILSLMLFAFQVYQKLKKLKLKASENSDWWAVGFSFDYLRHGIQQFVNGQYRFSPMRQFHFKDECVRMWNDADRILLRILLKIIKPVFKYIISPFCFHLAGPGGVKDALQYIQQGLASSKFHYAIRADIKSYYASINHQILFSQVKEHFHDSRVLHYLEHIITTAVDDGGNVFIPPQGIPRRSSLSPFFGALYLSPLDNAFKKRKGILYARYMDDIVILCQTKRQYQRARKIFFAILKTLKLKISPRKTWMGALKKQFHFLGVLFDVSTREDKNQCTVTIHPRSCRRALDKVKLLSFDAVHPALVQRYLVRWALWWKYAVKPLQLTCLLLAWVCHAKEHEPALAWLGSGLLIPDLPYVIVTCR